MRGELNKNFGCNPGSACTSPQADHQGPLHQPSSPPAGSAFPATAGGEDKDYLFRRVRWLQENADRMHRICVSVERRIIEGCTVRNATRRASWYYQRKPRFYRTAKQRRVRFTAGTILRQYYRWKTGGRTPEAVALRFTAPKRLANSAVLRVADLAMNREILSFVQAWRQLGDTSVTCSAYNHAMPARLRKVIRDMLKARMRALCLERKARRILGGYKTKNHDLR